jgi:hypothetical protein
MLSTGKILFTNPKAFTKPIKQKKNSRTASYPGAPTRKNGGPGLALSAEASFFLGFFVSFCIKTKRKFIIFVI